jgi:hypothetical protein
MDWPVQAARITLFPLLASGPSPRSALDLYRAIWGKDPDSFQGSQGGVGNPFPASMAQGVEGGIARICQSQPIRTDLTFGPVGTAFGADLVTIADTSNLHTQMRKVFDVVDSAFQGTPISRAAVYLQIGQEAPDFREANRRLASAAWRGRQLELGDEEDFILQFNRPRQDTSDTTVKLNFITKWSVERVQLLTFLSQFPAAAGTSQAPLVVEKIVPTIAFDNSNVALQKPFDPGAVPRMLSTLFNEFALQLKACNIALKGF